VTRSRHAAILGLIAASAFGPYLTGGFRTEQVAVYVSAVLMLVSAGWLRSMPSNIGVVVVALLGAHALMAGITALDPPFNGTRFVVGSALAGIDNLALPLAVVLITWTTLSFGAPRTSMVRVVCGVTVWAMVINAGLAVWATSANTPDLGMFHGQQLESVSDRAAQLGRYSGIFNQPAEAGLMYSVALIAAVYLYRERSLLLATIGTMITIGGVLTVSKTFLFIGFPVGVWHALRSSGGRQRRFTAFFVVVLAAWAAAGSGIMPAWKGRDFLLQLVPGARRGGSLGDYTAGRLGDSSVLSGAIDAVLDHSPVIGFGAGGLAVPYDTAWVEALAVNGLVGAAIYSAVLVGLVVAWLHMRRYEHPAELRLAGGLVIVVIGASVGLPALTANRCATIVWLLLTLLLLAKVNPGPGNPRSTDTSASMSTVTLSSRADAPGTSGSRPSTTSGGQWRPRTRRRSPR
jgi:hypothetical protein